MREVASASDVAAGGCHPAVSKRRLVPIDPLQYPGWDSLLAAHPGSSFFHSTAWARVLRDAYGHAPAYFCGFANGQLTELLAIAEVSSLWTGRRGVSLPFTDFCRPLKAPGERGGNLYEAAMEYG